MTRLTLMSSPNQEELFRLAATCRVEEGLSLLAGWLTGGGGGGCL